MKDMLMGMTSLFAVGLTQTTLAGSDVIPTEDAVLPVDVNEIFRVGHPAQRVTIDPNLPGTRNTLVAVKASVDAGMGVAMVVTDQYGNHVYFEGSSAEPKTIGRNTFTATGKHLFVAFKEGGGGPPITRVEGTQRAIFDTSHTEQAWVTANDDVKARGRPDTMDGKVVISFNVE